MKKIAVLLLAGSLTGCGFHAPQQGPVNPHLGKLQLVCGSVRAPLCGKLSNRLQAVGYTLRVDAPYRLELREMHLTQVQSPIGASVNRQYYDVNATLTYSISAKHKARAHDEIVQSQKLALTNANQIEGSQRQLQQVYADLINDLIDLLQIRIAHYEDTTRATQSSAKHKHSAHHSHKRRRTLTDPRSG